MSATIYQIENKYNQESMKVIKEEPSILEWRKATFVVHNKPVYYCFIYERYQAFIV